MPGGSSEAINGGRPDKSGRPRPPSSTGRLFVIKLVHSVIFWYQVAGLAYLAFAAYTRSFGWPVLIPIASILLNGLLLRLNHGRCPFTTLAERSGALKGSVSDPFLPDWVSRHIFVGSTTIFLSELAGLAVRYFARV